MRDLLVLIVRAMLNNDKVEVLESVEADQVTLTIKAPKDEIGLIIGKGGKVIKAIRNLVRVKATLEKKGLLINVEEI